MDCADEEASEIIDELTADNRRLRTLLRRHRLAVERELKAVFGNKAVTLPDNEVIEMLERIKAKTTVGGKRRRLNSKEIAMHAGPKVSIFTAAAGAPRKFDAR